MKYLLSVIVAAVFSVSMLYIANKADKIIEAKDARISELELQVWSLQLEKHLDSVKDDALETFHSRLNH